MTHTSKNNNDDDHLPSHYDARVLPYEEVLAGFDVDLEQLYLGSVLKYLYRYPYKENAVMDLIKARSYLNLLIDHLSNDQEESNSQEGQ